MSAPIHHGSTSVFYLADNDNVTYSYIGKYGSDANGLTEAAMLDYNYTHTDQVFESYFDGVATSSSNGCNEVITEACSGWWENENIDLTNPNSDADWYLGHCFITDPSTSVEEAAAKVNFNTLRGQSLIYGDWRCSSEDNSWNFDLSKCDWVNISGTKTLLEVKVAYKNNEISKGSSTLSQ